MHGSGGTRFAIMLCLLEEQMSLLPCEGLQEGAVLKVSARDEPILR